MLNEQEKEDLEFMILVRQEIDCAGIIAGTKAVQKLKNISLEHAFNIATQINNNQALK
jgi:hypothetical protein